MRWKEITGGRQTSPPPLSYDAIVITISSTSELAGGELIRGQYNLWTEHMQCKEVGGLKAKI